MKHGTPWQGQWGTIRVSQEAQGGGSVGQSLLWLQEGKVRQGTQAGLPHLNHFSGFWGVEAGLVVWPLTLESLRQGREALSVTV